ncbi:hypothetical protein BV898_00732 [Hypsibius exemplaris]|uniref:Uncharacterized protein n=1 Tax=Hypsibius exemplaris TaxID=2072580 RepID=A0A1W0XEB9_HYPEX|nr:hypothetical protein BV898_00732 [Hypsibius exemplaris]
MFRLHGCCCRLPFSIFGTEPYDTDPFALTNCSVDVFRGLVFGPLLTEAPSRPPDCRRSTTLCSKTSCF